MRRPDFSAALLVAALALPGCGSLSPRTDPSRFFALTPLADVEKAAPITAAERLSLGVGPVRLPGYLDREELVVRAAPNRFEVSSTDRWIEPLDENVTRVLAQNLAALLRADNIIRYPWPSTQRLTYQIEIDVLRFEPDPAEEIRLSARWTIVDGATKQVLAAKNSSLTRRTGVRSSEASVAAMSETLGDFSREIAEAVRAVDAKGRR